MAGSIEHVLDESGKIYQGCSLIENMGDAGEAIEQFVFVLLKTTTLAQRKRAIAEYYACYRNERPWPKWWQPNPDRSE